VNTKYFRKR